MDRLARLFPIAFVFVAFGCFGEDAKNTLVPTEPFGSGLTGTRQAMSAQTVSRTSSIRPASTESAARVDKLEIQSIDGAPIKGSPLEGMLREAGFGTTPKGVVLWPERRPVLA